MSSRGARAGDRRPAAGRGRPEGFRADTGPGDPGKRGETPNGDDLCGHRVIVGHADAPQLAEKVAAALRQKYGEKLNILFADVNPTAGSHCGPDTVGVGFHATHR